MIVILLTASLIVEQQLPEPVIDTPHEESMRAQDCEANELVSSS